MIQVHSSNIQSMGYDKENSILVVKFAAGWTYEYANVTDEVYALLAQAAKLGVSVSTVFNPLIRDHPETFPYRKV